MIKIRLSRVGVKNSPRYRIVAIDSKKKRSGTASEVLGHWDPIRKDLKIDKLRVNYWVSKGAQISDAINRLLKQ